MLVTLGVLFRLFHIIFSRSHLREIRDRSVLRLFESNEVTAPQALPGGTGVPQPLPQNAGGHWDQDQVSVMFAVIKHYLYIRFVYLAEGWKLIEIRLFFVIHFAELFQWAWIRYGISTSARTQEQGKRSNANYYLKPFSRIVTGLCAVASEWNMYDFIEKMLMYKMLTNNNNN